MPILFNVTRSNLLYIKVTLSLPFKQKEVRIEQILTKIGEKSLGEKLLAQGTALAADV